MSPAQVAGDVNEDVNGDVNEFIINDNFAYIDAIGTTTYHTYFVNPFNYKSISDAPGGVASNSMDYVDIKLFQQ